jgi:hypothetical protein
MSIWLLEGDGISAAKIPHALQMSEKIENPGLTVGKRRQQRGPDAGRIAPRYRLTRFRLQELQPDGPDLWA